MTNAKHTPLHNALLIGDEDLGFVLSLHNSDGTNYANIKLFGSKKQCEANASFIVTAVNSHYELLEACNKAIEATLDKVVGQAIKDGALLQEEMHAGLCLLSYIRRKYLKTYEQAIAKTEKN